MIIGKSRPEIENYDELVFASRNIKNQITIPKSIIKICPSSFQSCINLKCIEIPLNSELKIIGQYAFSESAIRNISIPSTVTDIGEYAFECCSYLKKIDIPQNSKLQKIEEGAFSNTSIVCFAIPQKVKQIDRNAFFWCEKLQIIEIGDNSEIEHIHPSAFLYSNLKLVMVQATFHEVSILFTKNRIYTD